MAYRGGGGGGGGGGLGVIVFSIKTQYFNILSQCMFFSLCCKKTYVHVGVILYTVQ